MKKIFIALMAFFLLVPNVAAQIPVAGEDVETANETEGCGTLEYNCEMVSFVYGGTKGGRVSGGFAAMLSQRIEADDGMRSLLMSDVGAMGYFEGLGFYNYKDYTARMDLIDEATPSPNPITYRVFKGKSDVVTEYANTTIYFINVPEQQSLFIVIAIEPKPEVEEYVGDIISGEDWTKEPENYFVFTG